MKFHRIKINMLIFITEKFLHKDAMELKIEKYRLSGAKIGQDVRAFSAITSAEPYLIRIGNNVTISTGVEFCTHDNSAIKVFENGTDFIGAIDIGDNSFIGMNSIIMGGVTLPENCIVGAGSVVTKSFDQIGSIIAGNPAKIIGNIESLYERKANNVFNFRKMDYEQKKHCIVEHPEKWIKK